MKSFRIPTSVAALSFAIAAMAPSAQALTPSQCKNLTNKACEANTACIWVNGYVRKDGREVRAYCRKAASRKSTKRDEAAKKAPASQAGSTAKQPAG